MSITTGDILRIATSYIFADGNIAMMIFNAVVTNETGPWDDDDIVADAIAWIQGALANVTGAVTDRMDGNELIVYVYDSVDDDWDEVGSDTLVWDPSQSAEELPRGVAALINFKTTDPDVNGKKYLPGMTESSNEDGSWIAAFLPNLADFADDIVGTFVGGTSGALWGPGVWSPTRTNFYLFSGSYLVPTIPAYQRRRKQGVGI